MFSLRIIYDSSLMPSDSVTNVTTVTGGESTWTLSTLGSISKQSVSLESSTEFDDDESLSQNNQSFDDEQTFEVNFEN